MKFILGKKIEMTQKFMPDGTVVPVTVVNAGPCFISQIKNIDKDGYAAVQIGYGEKKKLNKAQTGHLKGLNNLRNLVEFDIAADKVTYEKGQIITVGVFAKGDIANVIGVSKGKGFQGVIKRHGFHGHNRTHGTKDQERRSGSVGSIEPGHTFRGTRMSGRMGGGQVTIKNLEIIDIDEKNNLLFIKGAIPGCRNGLVEIIAPGEMKLEKEEKNIKDEEKPVEKKEEIKPGVEKKEEVKQEAEAQ